MQMYGVRNSSTACWRLAAVAKHSCKLNVALHYCCLPVKALLCYCRQYSIRSQRIPDSIHLHWGAQSLAIEQAWVDRHNVGVTTQYSSISVHTGSMYRPFWCELSSCSESIKNRCYAHFCSYRLYPLVGKSYRCPIVVTQIRADLRCQQNSATAKENTIERLT